MAAEGLSLDYILASTVPRIALAILLTSHIIAIEQLESNSVRSLCYHTRS